MFNSVPHKFEAGTPDIGAAIGLGGAVEYLTELGMDTVRAHERELTEYALEVLPRAVPDIHIYGPRSITEHAGIVTFNLPGIHPHDVATLLDRAGGRRPRRPPLHDAAPRAAWRSRPTVAGELQHVQRP